MAGGRGLRFTPEQARKQLGIDVRTRTVRAKAAEPSTAAASRGRVKSYATAVRSSRFEAEGTPGVRFSAWWHGAPLLPLNVLLRLDHRLLNAYRRAWHENAADAIRLAFGGRREIAFTERVVMLCYRRDQKLLDNDKFAAAFMFLTDGLRVAGLLRDDNPTWLAAPIPVQVRGAPLVGVSFTVLSRVDFPALSRLLAGEIAEGGLHKPLPCV